MKTKHFMRLLAGSMMAMFAVVFLNSGRLYAQHVEKDAADDERDWPQHTTLVLGGGLNYNMSKGPYQIDGNSYDVGHGYGPEFHLGLELPIGTDWMFAPRFNYSVIATTNTDGVLVTPGATFEPKFATDVRNVGLDVLFKASLSRFHILFGPYAGYMIKQTYAHGEFGDADVSTTKIPDIHKIFVSAGAGIGYDAPLNHDNTVWLTPEVFYSYPITNLGSGDLAGQDGVSHLKPSTLRGALSFKFNIAPTPAPAPVVATARPISATIRANEPAVPESGTTTRASIPMLPYVFFDDNSSAIPTRYSQSGSTGFSESSLQGKDALEVNHAVLDIVGSRMKAQPELTVNVTGANSNTGKEKHNVALSRARAMAIRDYLVNTWGISGDRIKVEARNLPEIPTNPVTPAGIEENRRAEILDGKSDDPVKFTDTKSTYSGTTPIMYTTSVSNPDNLGISNWRVTLDDNGTQVSSESGSGAPPSTINSSIPSGDRYIGKSLHYTLEVTDANGKTTTADGMTRVNKTSNTASSSVLENYAMLSFDFDRAFVNKRADKMVSLISESINGDSKAVHVDGFCDITGTDEYNQALSERRANAAADALRATSHMPDNVTVTGHGRNDPKFTNDLPEGRQLNRRVEVSIEKTGVAASNVKKED